MPHCAAIHRKLVSYQGNEFPVGGLVIFIIYDIPKELIDIFYLAPAPGYIDGMPYCSFHLAGRRIEFFSNSGIELFGNTVDYITVLHNHLDGFSQKMIALDVGGNAYG